MSWGLGSVWLGGGRKKRQNPIQDHVFLVECPAGSLRRFVKIQARLVSGPVLLWPWAMGPFAPFAPLPLCPFAPLPLCPFAPLPLCPFAFAFLPFCLFAFFFFFAFFFRNRQHHTTKRHVQVRPRAELHHRRSHVLKSWRSGTCTLLVWRYHTGRSRSSPTVHLF